MISVSFSSLHNLFIYIKSSHIMAYWTVGIEMPPSLKSNVVWCSCFHCLFQLWRYRPNSKLQWKCEVRGVQASAKWWDFFFILITKSAVTHFFVCSFFNEAIRNHEHKDTIYFLFNSLLLTMWSTHNSSFCKLPNQKTELLGRRKWQEEWGDFEIRYARHYACCLNLQKYS